ncbi:MAG: glutathione S-transferase family protein [Anaerolineae bacterium]
MKLFGHPDSGHAFKVKFCLEAGNIEHDYELLDIWLGRNERPVEFTSRSKFNEVPLLIDGDNNLVQSDAILLYIAKKFGIFGAESSKSLERCTEWLFWEANKIGLCLPQLRASKKFESMRLTEGAWDWLYARYLHDVGVMNAELSDGRPFILGDKLTIADFSLSGYLFFADEAEVPVPEHVAHWLDRLRAIPAWQHPYKLLASEIN